MFHETQELARLRMMRELRQAEAWRQARSANGSHTEADAPREASGQGLVRWLTSVPASLVRLLSIGRYRETVSPDCGEACCC